MKQQWTRVFLLLVFLFIICFSIFPSTLSRTVLGSIDDEDDDIEEGDAVPTFTGDSKNISNCRADDSSITVSVSSRFLNRAAAAIAPKLGDNLESFVIPPQTIPHGNTGEIFVHSFHVDRIRVVLARPTPSEITLSLRGLSFIIDESTFTISSGMTCSGKFWGTVNDASMVLHLSLAPAETVGEMKVNITNSTLKWGKSELHHKVSGKMCNMAEGVMSAFLGDLDAYLMKEIQEQLPEQLPAMLEEQLKRVLASSPIPYSSGPFLTKDTLTLSFQLVPLEYLAVLPPAPPSFIHIKSAQRLAQEWDAGIVLPAESAQHRVDLLMCFGALGIHETLPPQWNSQIFRGVFPELVDACPDCLVELDLQSLRPWKLEFNPRLFDLYVDGMELGVYMVTQSSKQAVRAHELILSDESMLPLGHPWLTEEFSRFTPTASRTRIPIGKIQFSGKLGAEDIWTINSRQGSKFFFKILPIDDISVKLLEMNIKGVTEKEVRSGLSKVLNILALGILAKRSPVELPSFVVDTELMLNQDFITFRCNLVVSEFLNTILQPAEDEEYAPEDDEESVPEDDEERDL